jgi:hypothetical protein
MSLFHDLVPVVKEDSHRFNVSLHNESKHITEYSAFVEEKSKMELSKSSEDYETIYNLLFSYIDEKNTSREAENFRILLRGNTVGKERKIRMNQAKKEFTEKITDFCITDKIASKVLIGEEAKRLGYNGLARRMSQDFSVFATKIYSNYSRNIGEYNAIKYFNGAEVTNTCIELKNIGFKKLDLLFSFRQLIIGMSSNKRGIQTNGRIPEDEDRKDCVKRFEIKVKTYSTESWYKHMMAKPNVGELMSFAISLRSTDIENSDFQFSDVLTIL